MARPKPSTPRDKTLLVRVDAETKAKIVQIAEHDSRSVDFVLRGIISDYLTARGKKK